MTESRTSKFDSGINESKYDNGLHLDLNITKKNRRSEIKGKRVVEVLDRKPVNKISKSKDKKMTVINSSNYLSYKTRLSIENGEDTLMQKNKFKKLQSQRIIKTPRVNSVVQLPEIIMDPLNVPTFGMTPKQLNSINYINEM